MAIRQEKMTLEKLAIMINSGFENAKIENQRQHEEIKRELREEIQEFRRENQKEHEEMKREQQDLKLRQDSVAYRFELVSLSGRVEKIEKVLKVESV